jgi:hypothetical protein
MEDNADAVRGFIRIAPPETILSGILWAVMSLWLLPCISRHDKRLVLLNSTASADSAERKINRDRD